eukprot:gene10787-16932_t
MAGISSSYALSADEHAISITKDAETFTVSRLPALCSHATLDAETLTVYRLPASCSLATLDAETLTVYRLPALCSHATLDAETLTVYRLPALCFHATLDAETLTVYRLPALCSHATLDAETLTVYRLPASCSHATLDAETLTVYRLPALCSHATLDAETLTVYRLPASCSHATDLGIGRTAKEVFVPYRQGGGIYEPWFAVTTAGNHAVCVLLDNNEFKCQSMYYGHAPYPDPVNNERLPPIADLAAVNFGTNRYATAVSFGYGHGCAILDNGVLKCWGRNNMGQVGNRMMSSTQVLNTGDSLPAVNLGTGRTAKAISCGRDTSCAILDNGNVKCWGESEFGELGQGNFVAKSDPGNSMPVVKLGTGRTATSISVGYYNVCAILDNGNVKCWGKNRHDDYEVFDIPQPTKPADYGTGTLGLGNKLMEVYTWVIVYQR